MRIDQLVLSFIVMLCVAGCGTWPPIVASKRDIERLSPSTPSIRARALSDADIPALARLQQLRILDFGGGHAVTSANITDRGLADLAALRLPLLETLTFGYTTNITDTGLVQIARMQSVKWLSLMVCQSVTDAGLPPLLSMTNLTALDLRGCTGITDSGLLHLARKTNWETIMFGGCPNVSTGAVAALQRALPGASVKKDDLEWSYHK